MKKLTNKYVDDFCKENEYQPFQINKLTNMTIKIKIHLTEWYITQEKNLVRNQTSFDYCDYSSTWLCFTLAWKLKNKQNEL